MAQMYLGPNHPQAIISRSSIFKNGIPVQVQELLDKCPSAKALLVTTDKVSAVMQGLHTPGSVYDTLHKQAVKEFEDTLPKKEGGNN